MKSFTPTEILAIQQATGVENVNALCASIRACGFDEARYLIDNPDLKKAGLGLSGAFVHFIVHGTHASGSSHRVPCSSLHKGLNKLLRFRSTYPQYFDRLVCRLYGAALEKNKIAFHLLALDELRGTGALPFLLIGGSHTSVLAQTAFLNPMWLAPMQ